MQSPWIPILKWYNFQFQGLIFLVCDWYFPSPRGFLDTTQKRRMCVMYEMIFSALWTLFYFSMFFACVAGWKKANADDNSDEKNLHLGAGNAKAIMGMSFGMNPLNLNFI